jgi:hypothetical protein
LAGRSKEILYGNSWRSSKYYRVEVNPDFVEIEKEYKSYNGGIYTDFPNVKIQIAEGRNFKKAQASFTI